MTPPWGINWLKYHQDQNDLPHVERMGYASFTIFQWMWNNRDWCNELVAAARKDAIFLNRDQPMSEQKDDQFTNDPAGKGRAHADDWAQKVKDGKVFTPLDRTYFLGINEPNSNDHQRQIDAYNEAYCRRMAEHGLRAAAYSFGVGHPSTIDLDPKKPPDWHWYEASAAAILEGGHIVATHEYGSHDNYGWGYWCGRIAHCPHPFTVVFDECGIDNGVTGGPLYGYQMYMKPLAAYCNWLDGFQVGQAQRAASYKVKIHSYNIFCYDFGTSDEKDWASYDIRPIRPALEAFQWTAAQIAPPTPPIITNLPAIGTGTQEPMQLTYSGIIEPLVAQAILNVESGSRAFGNDGKPLIRFEAHIFKSQLRNDALWADHFQTDGTRRWLNQAWRQSPGDPWKQIHTGKQTDEYAAFELAKGLHADAAYNSISTGAAQIMGFNHLRIGYPTAQAQFDAFADEHAQVIGFLNFCLSDPNLAQAMRDKDWRTVAALYNGSGNVDAYSALLQQAYDKLGGAP